MKQVTIKLTPDEAALLLLILRGEHSIDGCGAEIDLMVKAWQQIDPAGWERHKQEVRARVNARMERTSNG